MTFVSIAIPLSGTDRPNCQRPNPPVTRAHLSRHRILRVPCRLRFYLRRLFREQFLCYHAPNQLSELRRRPTGLFRQ